MSARRFVGPSVAVWVSLCGAVAPARAAVVWTATFETGDLSEWTSGTNSTKTLADGTVRKNVEVLGERVYSGKLAGKITVHPDDDFGQYHQDRVDIKHDSTLTGEGKDSYLSGYYFLPEDAQTRDEIAFYETKVTSRNWMDLWVEPNTGAGGGTTVKFGIESNGADLGSVLVWTGTWKAAQWHQFVIHVHWSTDATKGVVDLWLDGQQVVTAYKHKTKFDTNDMFFQTGLHRVLMQPSTETIYLDDFIEADTQADAKIGAPTSGGADAGAPDAGSSTDATGAAGSGAAGSGATTGAAGAAGTGAAGSGTTTGAAGSGAAGSASPTGAAGTGASGTVGATGAAGAAATPPGGTSGGCGCATSGGAASLPSALVLLALILRLRRRRP